MKVSILTDNIANKRDLLAEHGLSLYIEHNGINILFDTGQSSVYCHNASAMAIDLKKADCIVLSHGHYDHCGGLIHYPQTETFPKVFAHQKAFYKRYKKDASGKDYIEIGIPWNLEEYPDIKKNLAYNNHMLSPYPGVHILSEIERSTDFEDMPDHFYISETGCIVPDGFQDEQILVIETAAGLVVFSGCSHPGIINCLNHVKRHFPGKNLYALIAGMHMQDASQFRLERTIEHIREFGIQIVVPLHCTGTMAICDMKRSLQERCYIQAAGDTLSI